MYKFLDFRAILTHFSGFFILKFLWKHLNKIFIKVGITVK